MLRLQTHEDRYLISCLLESSNDSCPLITDVVTQEVNIQRGTSRKLLVGIHQRTAFQVEVTAIFCLRHSVKQSLLKVSCENGLIKHILLLGNVQQFALLAQTQ